MRESRDSSRLDVEATASWIRSGLSLMSAKWSRTRASTSWRSFDLVLLWASALKVLAGRSGMGVTSCGSVLEEQHTFSYVLVGELVVWQRYLEVLSIQEIEMGRRLRRSCSLDTGATSSSSDISDLQHPENTGLLQEICIGSSSGSAIGAFLYGLDVGQVHHKFCAQCVNRWSTYGSKLRYLFEKLYLNVQMVVMLRKTCHIMK